MKEKLLLEKYLLYTQVFKYESKGFLWEDKNLNNYIDRLDFIDISVLEIENPDFNVKKTTIKIKEKFKSCKILILIPEMNEKIENFICEFSIDAYLTFPVLPFQLIRILYCLKEV